MLTHTQIQHCLDEAIAFAGPRYTAALDVVTSAHIGLDFFGGIGDFQTWRDASLSPVIAELRSLTGWGDKALDILIDGKVSRPSACNSLETLLVHADVAAAFLPRAARRLSWSRTR